MKITRTFTKPDQDPFESVEWVKRTSRILNADGRVVFEMKDAEVPRSWSQLATDIMVSKYFRKAGVPQFDEAGEPMLDLAGHPITGPERSVRQVIGRLAGCWRHWGETHGYFDTAADAQAFHDELAHMMLHQMAAPNSPQWFNTGLHRAYDISGPPQGHWIVDPATGQVEQATDAYSHPQPHACVTGDTRVLTSDGWLTIREIVEDERTDLSVFDGQCWARIEAVKHNGRREVHRMMLANGQYVDLTDDHRVLSSAQSGPSARYEWVAAGDTLGQKVLYAMNQDRLDDEGRLDVGREAAELVGFQVGDGGADTADTADTYKGIGHFGDRTATDDEFETVSVLFDQVFGAHTVTPKPHVSDEYCAVRCRARVPEEIFGADASAQRAFLRGMFQADGAVRIRNENGRNSGDVCLATSSPELAHGVQTLLCGLGIYARVCRHDRADGYHVVIAHASERRKYADQIGFTSRAKTEKLARLNEQVRGERKPAVSEETVVSFRPLGVDDVYDIQTSTGRFGANGVVVHNCFIQSISDDLVNEGGIMDLWVREARLFKYGSGTGTNFSSLRGEDEPLSGGGKSSGLMSFLKIGDRAAGAIKSGGTTRRAAKMVCLDADHPDIEAFVNWKVREELKVAAMVEGLAHLGPEQKKVAEKLGLTLDYDFNGEAYYTVSGQNANNSVRLSDEFFSAVEKDGDWDLVQRTDGEVARTIKARELWDQICFAAWRCADPGIQYDTTINAWHTCPESGRINASNPCSEYMFLDNTACNLASINLLRFYDAPERRFDLDAFEHAIELWTVVLEISVLMAAFPSRPIAELSHRFRTLGLGYANLGAVLMQAGIPYDSDEARALCGAFSAILTGRSYATSAAMACELGAFPGYEDNRQAMLRVIRNHRRAAHGMARDAGEYEQLDIRPVPIDHATMASGSMRLANSEDVLGRATAAWDDALEFGHAHGFRNAQVSVIAPTGTIGLLMDCDTTGVEPDFALTKFKKLAGGGYFKIANQSLRPALQGLGYTREQIVDILTYVMGTLSLDTPMPGDAGDGSDARSFRDVLADAGYTEADLEATGNQLPSVFELGFAFTAWSMPEAVLERLGVDVASARSDPAFDGLATLGLDARTVAKLNLAICGTQTIEGAPHLADEHLPVFDCANKCGRLGRRFIAADGHIRMMAAAQPFISGAISKTINLPAEASVDDIAAAYWLSWELGLKANALYRDGSKLSQPLSTSAESSEDADGTSPEETEQALGEVSAGVAELASAISTSSTSSDRSHDASGANGTNGARDGDDSADPPVERIVERIIERPMRRRLPDTRRSVTHRFNVAGHEGYLTAGLYEDGSPGELFITMSKEGSTIGGLMDSLGTAISVALQYGVPIESLVKKFEHQRFEPMGMTTNRDIPMAKSLVDYIFRWLGMQFIAGYREANAPPRKPRPQPAPAGADSRRTTPEATANKVTEDKAWSDSDMSRDRGAGGHARAESPAPGADSARTGDGSAGVVRPAVDATRPQPDGSVTMIVESSEFVAVAAGLGKSNASLQGDAPACDVCGAITVRNGTCYKCLNCGNSMGCS